MPAGSEITYDWIPAQDGRSEHHVLLEHQAAVPTADTPWLVSESTETR
jgi:hypothetical protein